MKKINNDVFQRIEKKYLLSENNFNLLFPKIEPYMSIDKFGLHTICNIYYDTETFGLIRSSIEKPFYKEKLRLRSYGVPGEDSRVFLEIKKKYNHTVFKRRISLSFNEAWDYLELGIKPCTDSQILREIDYFIKLYNPKKKVFIAYDRIALFGKEDENLRITFDKDIRSRTNDLDLRKGDYGKTIYNCGYLMEVKTSASIPMWLARALSELEIFPVSYSKYGEVYKQDLVNTVIEFTPEKTFQSVLISTPDLKLDTAYQLYSPDTKTADFTLTKNIMTISDTGEEVTVGGFGHPGQGGDRGMKPGLQDGKMPTVPGGEIPSDFKSDRHIPDGNSGATTN